MLEADFGLDSEHANGGVMKRLLDLLTNIRIVSAEVGGTVTLVFLIVFGMYKAWEESIARMFR